jgi:hypothetical protein
MLPPFSQVTLNKPIDLEKVENYFGEVSIIFPIDEEGSIGFGDPLDTVNNHPFSTIVIRITNNRIPY